MTSRERVSKTLRGEPVDRLAAQPFLMMYAAKSVGVSYADYCRDHRHVVRGQMEMLRRYGVDCVVVSTDPAREVMDMVGEGAVRWVENQGPVVDESTAYLADLSRFAGLRPADPHAGGRMTDRLRAVESLRREVGQDVSVVGWIEGPLSFSSELRGISQLMEDLILEPEFVSDVFDLAVEAEVAFARAQLDAGADTIGMGEAATCLCSPALYRDVAFPRQKRIFEAIRASHPHAHLRFHCCGNTTHLLGQIGEIGADIVELDYLVDLAAARGKVVRPTISGNVSTVETLLTGTPEDVYAAAARCHSAAGANGRYIVGSGCDVAPATPEDNLKALIAYARDHR